MLRVEKLTSGYGRIAVLRDVSLEVAKGEMVALVGSNGAGKTTLLRAISGVQPVTRGTIVFDGQPIDRLAPHARVRAGIVQVPEGRQVFAPLPVADNLRLGAWTRRDAGRLVLDKWTAHGWQVERHGTFAIVSVRERRLGAPPRGLSRGR